MWYSFFLNSLIFTVSITVLLLRIWKALEELYVIVVTLLTTRIDSLRPEVLSDRSSLLEHRFRTGIRMSLRSEEYYARRPTPSKR